MTVDEFNKELNNIDWNVLFWSKDGVYEISSVNSRDKYINIKPINNNFGNGYVKLNEENCEHFHTEVQNPEIAFAMNTLKDHIFRELRAKLGNL